MGVNLKAFEVVESTPEKREQFVVSRLIARQLLDGMGTEERLALAGALIRKEATSGSSSTVAGAPTTPDELWHYIVDNYGIKVARVAVCDDHDTPFDFLCAGFFEWFPNIFGIGPRGGGKSFDMALLHALNSRMKPGCTSSTFGAVDEQSKKVYQDMVSVFLNGGLPDGETEVAGESTQLKTLFKNGSEVNCFPGCLTQNTNVITRDGPMRISTMVSQRHPGPVKSYNFAERRWEWKEVTDWLSHGPGDDWMQIKVNAARWSSMVTCTPGHEMVRPDGTKVSLANMDVGEEVMVQAQHYSDEQEQVLMGLMLGDGYVGNFGVLRVAHARRQEYYLEWIIDAFSEFGVTRGRRPSHDTVSADFEVTRRTKLMRDELYATGKKRIPDRYWDDLGVLGLAVWVMDDGGFVKRPDKGFQSAYWTIATHQLDAHEREGASRFFDRIGVDHRWQLVDAEKDQWIWSTVGEEAALAMTSLLADYIDVSARQAKGWKRWSAASIVEHSRDDAVPARIAEMRTLEPGKGYRKYDITVADNHNYLVNTGLLVGNTLAKVNGPHPPKVHSDEVEIMKAIVWAESRNMAADKIMPDGRVIKAQNMGTSTRKWKNGRVDKIYQEFLKVKKAAIERFGALDKKRVDGMIAAQSSFYVFIWCIFEVAQQVPNCRCVAENADLPEFDFADEENLGRKCGCHEVINGTWDKDGKVPRTLMDECKGRFHRSRGHRSHWEVRQLFRQNDRGTWEAQQTCREADTEGLYVKSFSRNRHGLKFFPIDPANGPIYNGVDWGTTHFACSLLVQYLERAVEAINYAGEKVLLPAGARVIFSEIYEADLNAEELGRLQIVREVKLAGPTSFARLPVRKRFADVQGAGDRKTWRKMGLKTSSYGSRIVSEHVKEVRGLYDADRAFVVADECPHYCDEMESWREDEKGVEVDENFNHAMAGGRYVFFGMHGIYNDPAALAPEDGAVAAMLHQAQAVPAVVGVTTEASEVQAEWAAS